MRGGTNAGKGHRRKGRAPVPAGVVLVVLEDSQELEGPRPSNLDRPQCQPFAPLPRQRLPPGDQSSGRVCEVEPPADFVAKRRSRGLSGPYLSQELEGPRPSKGRAQASDLLMTHPGAESTTTAASQATIHAQSDNPVAIRANAGDVGSEGTSSVCALL
jgi:hypothetical protein